MMGHNSEEASACVNRVYRRGLSIEELVYQALGNASVCWTQMDGHGTFKSEMCQKIGEQLINDINRIRPESLDSQVGRLANFIMSEIPYEPSRSEGAIDTAIRLLKERFSAKTSQKD